MSHNLTVRYRLPHTAIRKFIETLPIGLSEEVVRFEVRQQCIRSSTKWTESLLKSAERYAGRVWSGKA